MVWHKAILIALATAAAVMPAYAQWKWKDARGQVHVSDLPPPRDVPAKDIILQPAAAQRRAPAPQAAASGPAVAVASAPEAKPKVDPELEAKRKAAEQDKASKSKAEDDKLAAARADNCKRAREQVAALESGMRVVRVNPNGEREFLDDKARADEMARARQIAQTDCR